MRLDSISSGSAVFIDANIFIYHFTGLSSECGNFLSRCEHGDLVGITSVNVLLEVLHRLMMVEAFRKNIVKPPNIVKKLKKYPEKIKQLNDYFANTQKISEMGIIVKPISWETILKSQTVRLRYGFMVNDSLVVASMEEENLSLLATNDTGFSILDGFSLYRPSDLELR